jgi:hypothetical protein
MQFRVPQFIDIEDKILGPLSWKQFAYVLGAAAIAYISLRLLPSKIVALFVGGPFIILFLSLAFVRINDRPFVDTLQNAFAYFFGGNIYTWQKDNSVKSENSASYDSSRSENVKKEINNTIIKRGSSYEKKNLQDLAVGLDIKSGKEDSDMI